MCNHALMEEPKHPLTAYRKANGEMSLFELGLLLGGANKSTVLRWESGKVPIPVERAKAISEKLKIPLHELRPDVWDGAA